MSEYYLADRRAEEREQSRKSREKTREPKQSQDMKITLLGDFLFPSNEPRGCDPYNAMYGKSPRELWQSRRERR
jgi:hypothetical protein